MARKAAPGTVEINIRTGKKSKGGKFAQVGKSAMTDPPAGLGQTAAARREVASQDDPGVVGEDGGIAIINDDGLT